MTLLAAWDGPGHEDFELFEAGQRLVVKEATDHEPAYNLSGMLYAARGWLLLSVPNSLIRGVFQAMHEPGAELPPGPDGRVNAHITVMRPEEVERVGGVEKINERGKRFRYTLGRLVTFRPDGWSAIDRVWSLLVHSPELQELRRTYGLSSLPDEGNKPFHCTVATKRKGVTGRNEVAKV